MTPPSPSKRRASEPTGSPSFTFAPDSTGRPYHWRVRGVSAVSNGPPVFGPWSQAWSFTSTPRTVQAPAFGFSFLTTANAAGPLAPPEPGAFGFAGFPIPEGTSADRPNGARQQTTGGLLGTQGWGIFTFGNRSTYSEWLSRVLRDGINDAEVYGSSFEWRFTGSSKALRFFEDQAVVTVPFELWSLGTDLASPSDDVRMIPYLCEAACGAGTVGTFDIGGDSPLSADANDPVSDGVYWSFPVDRRPGQAGYLAYANGTSGGVDATQVGAEAWARMTLVGLDFGTSGSAYPLQRPEPGTVFQIRRTATPGTPPALASPASGAREPGTSVTFRWSGAAVPVGAPPPAFEFQLARDAAFASLVRSDTVRTDVYASGYTATGLAARRDVPLARARRAGERVGTAAAVVGDVVLRRRDQRGRRGHERAGRARARCATPQPDARGRPPPRRDAERWRGGRRGLRRARAPRRRRARRSAGCGLDRCGARHGGAAVGRVRGAPRERSVDAHADARGDAVTAARR